MTEVAEALLLQNLRGTPARRQLTLAGQLAGIQFEREVMELARAVIENNKGTDYEGRLSDICKGRDGRLSRMVRSGLELPSDVRQRWVLAVDFRNTAVHEPERLRPQEAVLLLIVGPTSVRDSKLIEESPKHGSGGVSR